LENGNSNEKKPNGTRIRGGRILADQPIEHGGLERRSGAKGQGGQSVFPEVEEKKEGKTQLKDFALKVHKCHQGQKKPFEEI